MGKEFLEIPFEVKEITDDGIFNGYGSTFGGTPDAYGDVVQEGAFDKTIAKGGKTGFGVAMLWQHDPHSPIGTWMELASNKKGLKVTGRLTKGVQLADEAYLLMKDGALKGLSIGYDTVKYSWDEKKEIRYLEEIDLWEISPVTFPANTRAQITNVKRLEQVENVRELEGILREAGLSRKEALIVTKMCRPFLREKGKSIDWNSVLPILKDINSEMLNLK